MRCPECSNQVPEGKQFCGHCGHRLAPVEPAATLEFDEDAPTQVASPEPVEAARPVEESAPTATEPGGAVCPACGAENRVGARFCDACGAGLAEATPQRPSPPQPDEPAEAPETPMEEEPKEPPLAQPDERVEAPPEMPMEEEEEEPRESPSPQLDEPAEAPPETPMEKEEEPEPGSPASPEPPSRRRPPRWVGIVVGLAAVVLVVVALVATGAISLPGPAVPAATRTPRPISTSRPAPTSAPAQPSPEPVVIGLTGGDKQVPADTPIVLGISWVAETPEQVADFVASIELTVALDGSSLPNTEDYWGEIEEWEDLDEDGDPEYGSSWRYPVGVLDEGSHWVDSGGFLHNPVIDGGDYDEDGEPDVFEGQQWDRTIEITVGE